MKSSFRAYDLETTLALLGLDSASTLYRSGLDIPQPARGVYEADAVEDWSDRLARRRAYIRLGLKGDKSALADAPSDDSYDLVCPSCGRLAVQKPWTHVEEVEAADWPSACGWCGWRNPDGSGGGRR